MSSPRLRCTRCDIPLEPGTERCPRCLRQSTVVDTRAPKPVGLGGEPAEEKLPSHVAVRLGLWAASWVVSGPALWLLWSAEAWLKGHEMWLGAVVAAMGLATLPLRAAFVAPTEPQTARQAARSYALLIAGAMAGAVLFGGAVAASEQLVPDVAALGLGLLLFLLLLLCGPVVVGIVTAVRHRRPARPLLVTLARNAGLALLVVGLVAALVALGALRAKPRPAPLTIPVAPSVLLDPR